MGKFRIYFGGSMNKIIFMLATFLFSTAVAVMPSYACGYDKDDIYFNIDRQFYIATIPPHQRNYTTKLAHEGRQATIMQRPESDEITLVVSASPSVAFTVRTGRLVRIQSCIDSPTYIKWDLFKFTPESYLLGKEFETYYKTSRPPIKLSSGYLTVIVNAGAQAFMAENGFTLKNSGESIDLIHATDSISISGYTKENVFVLISAEAIKDTWSLTILETTKNGEIYRTAINSKNIILDTKQFR